MEEMDINFAFAGVICFPIQDNRTQVCLNWRSPEHCSRMNVYSLIRVLSCMHERMRTYIHNLSVSKSKVSDLFTCYLQEVVFEQIALSAVVCGMKLHVER